MALVEINFVNETDFPVDKNSVGKTLELILRRLDHLGRVSTELVLVGDSKIRQLNKKFRGRDETTDVLSFSRPLLPDEPKTDFSGSIVISVDTAIRQAKAAGITQDQEINALSGHGFLHLLGYNHY